MAANATTCVQVDAQRTDSVESLESDVAEQFEPNVAGGQRYPQDIPIRFALDLDLLSSIGGSPTKAAPEDLIVTGPNGIQSHLGPLEAEKETSVGWPMYYCVVFLFSVYLHFAAFVLYVLLRQPTPP